MGYTFVRDGVQIEFRFNEEPAEIHAIGNNAAWACHSCQHPVLFVYRGQGGKRPTPSVCPGCGCGYYLDPEFSKPEPSGRSVPPADRMTIIKLRDSTEDRGQKSN